MKTFALIMLLPFALSAPSASRIQVYKATFDYYTLNTRGKLLQRVEVSGTYSRDLDKKTATWNHVSQAGSRDMNSLGAAEPSPFMEGFTYGLHAPNMMDPAFFRGVPETAMHERNLVWDARMFEVFGEDEFPHLKPGVVHHLESSGPIDLAGAGTFVNKNAVLSLTGQTIKNGQSCTVVDYQAFFNDVHLQVAGAALDGRSHYWGQIWVNRRSKSIEYATLYEDVLLEQTRNNAPQPVNVFRIGTFERTDRH